MMTTAMLSIAILHFFLALFVRFFQGNSSTFCSFSTFFLRAHARGKEKNKRIENVFVEKMHISAQKSITQ